MNTLHVVCLSTFKREHVCETSLKERRDIGTLAKLGKKGEVQERVLKWTSPSAAVCFSAVGAGALGPQAIGFSFPEI